MKFLRKSSQPKRVMIIGSFSGSNFGDSIVLFTIINIIDNILGNSTQYIVPTSKPNFITKWIDNPRVKAINIRPYSLSYRFFGLPTIFAIPKTDLIITTAGIFFDHKLFNPKFNFISSLLPLSFIAKSMNIPLIGLGVGIYHPTSNLGGFFLSNLLLKHNFIFTRDNDSYRVCKSLGYGSSIEVCADIAHTLFKKNTTTESKYEEKGALSESANLSSRSQFVQIFGVNIASYLSTFSDKNYNIDQNILLTKIAFELSTVCKKFGMSLKFIATCISDHYLHQKLAKFMNSTPISFEKIFEMKPKEGLAIFENLSLFVGSRMHACIFATCNIVPTVALEYHPKVRSYMNEIAMHEWIINFSDLKNTTILSEKLIQLYSRKLEIKEILSMARNERHISSQKAVNSLSKIILDSATNL